MVIIIANFTISVSRQCRKHFVDIWKYFTYAIYVHLCYKALFSEKPLSYEDLKFSHFLDFLLSSLPPHLRQLFLPWGR